MKNSKQCIYKYKYPKGLVVFGSFIAGEALFELYFALLANRKWVV